MPALHNYLLFTPDAADEGVALGIAVIEAAAGQVHEVDIDPGACLEVGYELQQGIFVDISHDKQFDTALRDFF